MRIDFSARLHYRFRDMFKHKGRAVLSILGIFLALLILMTGYFTIDSHYSAQFHKYKHYQNNELIHTKLTYWSETDQNLLEEKIQQIEEHLGNTYLLFQKNGIITMPYSVSSGEKNVKIALHFYQTNQNFNGTLVRSEQIVKATRLRSGRGISTEDITQKKKVVVIDSITDDILFHGKATGQTLRLPIYSAVQQENGDWKTELNGYECFEIIGVFECDQSAYADFQEKIRKLSAVEEYIYNAECYIPVTCSVTEEPCTQLEMIYSNQKLNNSSYRQLKNEFSDSKTNFTCYTYSFLAAELQTEISSMKMILNGCAIVLLAISILLITQTMLFSIKENLSEYGIKKALGASEARLAIDILFISFGYGVIAFAAALIGSILITLIILNLLFYFIEPIPYTLILKPNTLLLCCLMAMLTSCLASVAPMLYMSKKTIVEIIKFE